MNRIVAAIVVLASAAGAPAQGFGVAASTWQHLKTKYDADGDGRVTEAEYGRGGDKFARFDVDGDGVLTAADFERRGPRRGTRRGGGRQPDAGAGGQGRGLRGALAMLGPEFGKAADSNRDGTVSPAEWQTYLASLQPDEAGVIVVRNVGFLRTAMAERVARQLDIDRDGEITIGDLGELFAAVDSDADGTLQRRELGDLPIPGDAAPAFRLPYADDRRKTFDLSSFVGKKPVALVFGSYT